MQKSILIVDDEPAIRDMIHLSLKAHGFQITHASDCQTAFMHINEHTPDLILLDWVLPGQSGLDFVKQLRKDKVMQHIPIIMLSAKALEDNRVNAFDVGVDDYVSKPFSPRELVARVKAICRRGFLEQPNDSLEVGGLRMNTLTHEVTIFGMPVKMGPIEYRLLHFFLTHKDRVYTREQLIHYIWSATTYVDDRTVDVHILRLRKALHLFNHSKYIETVRGVGYKMSSKNVCKEVDAPMTTH